MILVAQKTKCYNNYLYTKEELTMYSFIVNPNARSGLGQKVWDELETLLKKSNTEYEVFFTKYQRHATNIVSTLTSDGNEHIIVALGGDGTVNEVVNGIIDFDKTILGYIPIGSSNDFARGLGLPTDPIAALKNILKCPNLLPLNIGEICYKNKKKRFAVSAGMGFDADICHEAVVSRVKKFLNKLKLGKLTYVCIALHRLFLTKPCDITITLDKEKTETFKNAYFVAMMNSKYEGGGVMFCPKAKNHDDVLDLMIVSDVPKLKVLVLIPFALFGWHVHFHGAYERTCRQVEIHAKNPLPLHTDGEPIFLQRDLSASLLPQKLRVITSKKF